MREEEEKIKILTEQGKAKRKELSDQGTQIRKALEVSYPIRKQDLNTLLIQLLQLIRIK